MLTNIQALRAIAALMVLMYHAMFHLVIMDDRYTFLLSFTKYGYIGVDIFFIISGYVIALTTTQKPRKLRSAIIFVENRFARIYLGYWPFLLIIFLIFKKISPLSLKEYHLRDSVLLYTNQMNYLLPVAWSLTYELYFYLIFIPLFFVSKKYLGPVIVALFFIVLYTNLNNYFIFNTTHWFLTNPYLLEFFSGAIFYHYQSLLARKKYLFFVAIISLPAYAVGYHHDYQIGMERVFTFGIFALGLFWIFMILEKESLFIFSKTWENLGNASYTIYLSHVPFLMLFYAIGLRDWLHLQHPLIILSLFILLIYIIITSSVQFYRFIEAPLYRLISH